MKLGRKRSIDDRTKQSRLGNKSTHAYWFPWSWASLLKMPHAEGSIRVLLLTTYYKNWINFKKVCIDLKTLKDSYCILEWAKSELDQLFNTQQARTNKSHLNYSA